MHAKLEDVEDVPGGAQITTELTFEREDGDKPVCVAETLARVYAVKLTAPAGPAAPAWRDPVGAGASAGRRGSGRPRRRRARR